MGSEPTTAHSSTRPHAGPAPAGPRVVRLDAVADHGTAVGRLEGKVVFVPFGAPGDRAEVEFVRERPRYAQGRLLRLLAPSPLRRPPPCPAFGNCGGCQWQHLPYEAQWAGKAAAFQGFVRSRLGLSDACFGPAIPSPSEWGYRNRVSLKVRRAGTDVLLGFYEKGSHRLAPLRRCPVLAPAVEAAVAALAALLQDSPAADALAQADLQQDADGGVWAVLHAWRAPTPSETEEVRRLAGHAGLAGAYLQAGRKTTLSPLLAAPSRLPLRVRAGGRDLRLGLSPGGFAQANDGVNQALVDAVAGLVDLYRGRRALDLFCGAGNFTLPLALEASEAVGVEGYPPAAEDARQNAAANGLDNVRVLAEPAARGSARLAAEGFRPAFALLDPPREGAGDEAVRALARLGPEHIVYISCAPPTLVRDLGAFASEGYRVQWVRAADMFPQTAHVESMTLLRREAAGS